MLSPKQMQVKHIFDTYMYIHEYNYNYVQKNAYFIVEDLRTIKFQTSPYTYMYVVTSIITKQLQQYVIATCIYMYDVCHRNNSLQCLKTCAVLQTRRKIDHSFITNLVPTQAVYKIIHNYVHVRIYKNKWCDYCYMYMYVKAIHRECG